jgi:hypothetical protein
MSSQTSTAQEDFFDAEFLSELEELANVGGDHTPGVTEVSSVAAERLQEFLTPPAGSGIADPLDESGFVGLSSEQLGERIEMLVDVCRRGATGTAARAVENSIVFFQALLPTLASDGAEAIKRVFFRLVPTLIHIAYNDFAPDPGKREDGRAALRNLERILIEISSIRLAPGESELIFRSIDQMTGFIGVAEYTMANDVISSQLLSIIERNRLQRALFRLMEAEVAIQRFLKEKLGHPTPRLRIPDDLPQLRAYAPIRVFHEEGSDGVTRQFLEIQVPDMRELTDVVIKMVGEQTGVHHDLRLDALGSTELKLPDDTWALGLLYEPAPPR